MNSSEVPRKNYFRLNKGSAYKNEMFINEKAITDKLVLSPLIVRAKLLKIVKNKTKTRKRGRKVITLNIKVYLNLRIIRFFKFINTFYYIT